MAVVVGVDRAGAGWLFAAVEEGALAAVEWHAAFRDGLEVVAAAATVGVDIPIWLPETGVRASDRLARGFLGRLASSVFNAPPRCVAEARDYAEANRLARERAGTGISRQSWALTSSILEVEAAARTDDRIFEVHPEVSFAAMAGGPLGARKKSWQGAMVRRRLLQEVGLSIPDDLGEAGRRAGVDDVLDAVAVAWTAERRRRGVAAPLPSPPEVIDGRPAAIWY